ncbi:HU family DNA-binding protein [Shewanella colwelliana]|uniref:HU family DNA-binding protein n=1 Tax=Shewanella colwelliana TaxID=23 RepID=UPI003734C4B5
MNKTRRDLAKYVRLRTEGYTTNEMQAITDDLLEDILTLAMEGRVVSIKNLGQLRQVTKTPRPGRNPKTKVECIIPARKRLVFSFVPKLTFKERDS